MAGRVGSNVYDQLTGYQVIVRFEEEIKREEKVDNTGKHRAHLSVFEGNVECTLDLPIKTREIKL